MAKRWHAKQFSNSEEDKYDDPWIGALAFLNYHGLTPEQFKITESWVNDNPWVTVWYFAEAELELVYPPEE